MSDLDWQAIDELTKSHGESFFIYDDALFESNFKELDSAFNRYYPLSKIAYSYKTNYMPFICNQINQLGGYAEVVSEMEYALAKKLGVDDKNIIYNGPYKSPESLKTALLSGAIVNIDSLRDFEIASNVSEESLREGLDQPIGVAIRCNFPIDDKLQSRFGLDIEGDEFRRIVEEIEKMKKLRLIGLHCHFPNRDLDSFGVRASEILKLCRELFSGPPEFINIGGGFFGEIPESLKKVFTRSVPSFDDYGKLIGKLFNQAFPADQKRPTLFIEPGTALVANTMKFVTEVISVKRIRERCVATVSGSIFNISPRAQSLHLPVTIVRKRVLDETGNQGEKYDVCGFTCIENDYLTKSLRGPLEPGDFLVYGNVGSYSIVMKPPFILPNVPVLRKNQGSNEYSIIKRKETFEWMFSNFV